MWWWIAGIVIALVLFACWIAWELYHAPLLPELLDGCFSSDDDKEDDKEVKS